MKKIAVIGSLNVDYVLNVNHTPMIGETILSNKLDIQPGGKGANQAYAISRMGSQVSMFGAVGDDTNAPIVLDNLRNVGVDVTNVVYLEEPTGVALITVDSNGDNCIIVSQGANAKVSAEYIDLCLSILEQYDIIIFQLEIPLETVKYAADKLKKMGKTIILDPAPAPGKLPDELLKNVDYIKPNENELSKLSGITDITSHLEEACDILLGQGVKCVLASLGSAGVMIKNNSGKGQIYPAEKIKAIDTTAAGDSFTAAIAYALANERSIEQAVRFANKVAALVVQREGAQRSIPSKETIQEIWCNI